MRFTIPNTKELAIEMVTAYLAGYRIVGLSGTIYKRKDGAPDNMNGIMSTTQAAECKRWLALNKISMRRIDSGGSPEWEFIAEKS